jgi:5-methylcytosine-specific restriction endonuclease McrA
MGRPKTNTPESLKKYKAEYYQKNKGRIVRRQKEWAKNNPQKIKIIKKRWRERNFEDEKKKFIQRKLENPEVFRDYQRKYARNNLEKTRAASEKWRIENRDYQKRYLELNPERFRVASAKRRAIKKSNSTPAQIDSANRKIIRMLKNKFVLCPYCEEIFKPLEMHVDHILALNRGGAHSAENVTLACKKCNLSKGDKILNTEWTPPILIYATQN